MGHVKMKISDGHIVQIAAGDLQSFRHLYEELFHSLVVFARRMVDDRDDAGDIVQESLVVFWQRKCDFKTIANVKGYLYSTVRNKCANYLRKKKVESKFANLAKQQNDTFYISRMIEEETYAILDKAIKKLPEKTRIVIERSINGERNSDIADNMGVSINTIKTLKMRAYRKLRRKLVAHLAS